MRSKALFAAVLLSFPFLSVAQEQDFSYDSVAERFAATRLDAKSVEDARMHGECLVGLKHLIFIKRDHFDPVAEWINYRTISLLEQLPPCNVLIMMEVAKAKLMDDEE